MRRNKEKTIEDLMKAAYIIFSKKGYEKATVDDIATAAGYTKGAFYWHFLNKEDLFLKIIDYKIDAQQTEFLAYFSLKKDLFTNVHDVFSHMIELTQKDNWTPIFIEFLAQAERSEKVKEKMSFMYTKWRVFIEKILEQLQESGFLSKEINIHSSAVLIIAVFDGINMQNLVNPGIIDFQDVIKYIAIMLSSST
ncbi:MAG: TetR/AcrR family transcriptional regulator [Carboxydocellales bacterium]